MTPIGLHLRMFFFSRKIYWRGAQRVKRTSHTLGHSFFFVLDRWRPFLNRRKTKGSLFKYPSCAKRKKVAFVFPLSFPGGIFLTRQTTCLTKRDYSSYPPRHFSASGELFAVESCMCAGHTYRKRERVLCPLFCWKKESDRLITCAG